jgi:NAD(P)H-hydrate epimerase
MTVSVQNVSALPPLPVRAAAGHKGTFGRILVVAGGRGMSGAAVLCGSAAVRGGAGLVKVACPAAVQDVVAVGNPCYTTAGIPLHADGTLTAGAATAVGEWADQADVLAVGPGLGNRPDVGELVRELLQTTPHKPLVLDADGLNVLSPIPDVVRTRSAPLVLTPHPGEFARLLNVTTEQVQANRLNLAIGFAATWNVVLLLKGPHTVVTDGARVYVNGTGNPGMGTGGSGDVLTGLIAALIGQGMSGFDAAVLGAWVHGRAGDVAAEAVGQTALCAVDILTHLPTVLREVERNSRR